MRICDLDHPQGAGPRLLFPLRSASTPPVAQPFKARRALRGQVEKNGFGQGASRNESGDDAHQVWKTIEWGQDCLNAVHAEKPKRRPHADQDQHPKGGQKTRRDEGLAGHRDRPTKKRASHASSNQVSIVPGGRRHSIRHGNLGKAKFAPVKPDRQAKVNHPRPGQGQGHHHSAENGKSPTALEPSIKGDNNKSQEGQKWEGEFNPFDHSRSRLTHADRVTRPIQEAWSDGLWNCRLRWNVAPENGPEVEAPSGFPVPLAPHPTRGKETPSLGSPHRLGPEMCPVGWPDGGQVTQTVQISAH